MPTPLPQQPKGALTAAELAACVELMQGTNTNAVILTYLNIVPRQWLLGISAVPLAIKVKVPAAFRVFSAPGLGIESDISNARRSYQSSRPVPRMGRRTPHPVIHTRRGCIARPRGGGNTLRDTPFTALYCGSKTSLQQQNLSPTALIEFLHL